MAEMMQEIEVQAPGLVQPAIPVTVTVQMLAGDTLELSLDASSSGDDVKAAVMEARKLTPLHINGCELVCGTATVAGTTKLESILQDGAATLSLQFVKRDPLLPLGNFEFKPAQHAGLSVLNARGDCKFSRLVKTSLYPDSSSSNVFVCHRIREDCYVEFQVVRSGGQMSFGVTHKPAEVIETFGIANRSSRCTWIYSKQSRAMPTWLFGGVPIRSQAGQGFQQGDLVAVYVNPEKRQVKFWRNGELVCDNLPNRPLPDANDIGEDTALRVYAMVDVANDEVWIQRFGPGQPYPDPEPQVSQEETQLPAQQTSTPADAATPLLTV